MPQQQPVAPTGPVWTIVVAGGSSDGRVLIFAGSDLGLNVSAKPAGAGWAIGVDPFSTPAIHSFVVAT